MGGIELWKGEGMKLKENSWKAGSWWQSLEQRRRLITAPHPHTHTGSAPSPQLNLSGRALCWDSGGPHLDQGRVHTPGGLGHSRSPRKQRTYSWACLEALGPSWRFSLQLRTENLTELMTAGCRPDIFSVQSSFRLSGGLMPLAIIL